MTLFRAVKATMPSSERKMLPASSIVTVLGMKAGLYIVVKMNEAKQVLIEPSKFDSNFVRIQ
jgi:hypothetical protein